MSVAMLGLLVGTSIHPGAGRGMKARRRIERIRRWPNGEE